MRSELDYKNLLGGITLATTLLVSNAGTAITAEAEYSEHTEEGIQQSEQEMTTKQQALNIIGNFLNLDESTSASRLFDQIAKDHDCMHVLEGFDIPGNTFSQDRKLYEIRFDDKNKAKKSKNWSMQIIVDQDFSGNEVARIEIAIDKRKDFFKGNDSDYVEKVPLHVLGTISDFVFNIPEGMKSEEYTVWENSSGEIVYAEREYVDDQGNYFIQSFGGNTISFQSNYPIPEMENKEEEIIRPGRPLI